MQEWFTALGTSLVPVVANDTIRGRSDLSYLSWDALLSPKHFEGSIAGFVQEKRSSSSQPWIFFTMLVNVQRCRMGRLVIVHQKNSAFLDPKRRQLIGRHIRGLSNIVS
jgi:hypothetical protein